MFIPLENMLQHPEIGMDGLSPLLLVCLMLCMLGSVDGDEFSFIDFRVHLQYFS